MCVHPAEQGLCRGQGWSAGRGAAPHAVAVLGSALSPSSSSRLAQVWVRGRQAIEGVLRGRLRADAF